MKCSFNKKNGDPCPLNAVEGTEPPGCQFHRTDKPASPSKVKSEARAKTSGYQPKARADGQAPICDLGCFPGGWDMLPADCKSAGCAHGTYNREA